MEAKQATKNETQCCYQVTYHVDETGATSESGSWTLGEYPTLKAACKAIIDAVIPGVRGPGCFGIHAGNDMEYYVDFDGTTHYVHAIGPDLSPKCLGKVADLVD